MSKMYLVPLTEIRRELIVVNSRFISTLAPAFSIDEARAFMARIKHEFADASHNVPVYIIGGGNTVTEYFSDDGEPSGTSGKPALAVMRGSGLGDHFGVRLRQRSRPTLRRVRLVVVRAVELERHLGLHARARIVGHALAAEAGEVEVSEQAEADWVTLLQSHARAFIGSPECTPGYYNNEGGPIGPKERLNGSGYPMGPIAYWQYLDGWRSSGTFAGLDFR